MPTIVFYEVNETAITPDTFPGLTDAEGIIFDYINDQGAASLKGVVRQSRNMGYSRLETSYAIGRLVTKNLITRRNLTVELDEDI